MDHHTDQSNVGYTLFKATGVRHEFPHVDLAKQQVTGTVLYKGKIYMTVTVDVKMDLIQVQGDVADLGELSMDRESYIDLFRNEAKFFIENNITDPKKYYDELLKDQS